jgi:hypothetical protein
VRGESSPAFACRVLGSSLFGSFEALALDHRCHPGPVASIYTAAYGMVGMHTHLPAARYYPT